MKSITKKLITVATVLVLGAHASAALSKSPANTPGNNYRHAQTVGGDGVPLHTVKNNTRYARNTGLSQDTDGARSPARSQKNNVYKQVINNAK